MHAAQLLEWYIDAGVDEAIEDSPINRLQPPPSIASIIEDMPRKPAASAPAPASAPQAPSEAMAKARALADACKTREELLEAVRNFDGCALKKTAMNTVFSDGSPQARIMVIGEAPGAQEDIQGIPFCGPSGQLLDKMLASIGLSRQENVYISNTVFWRPPGNRTPSPEELAICEPFVQKHIALMQPKLLLLAGGVAASAVLKRPESVGRLRGKPHEYTNPYLGAPVPAIVTFHPSYLMRSPGQKRLAWSDLLMIQDWLAAHVA